jgi:Flp pilus assembly protein TadD
MNPQDETREEEVMAAAMSAADKDVAPLDSETLAKLRAQSTDAFAKAKKPWFARRAVRWLAAAAVLAVAVGAYAWIARSGLSLGQALENTAKADTLHARWTSNGKVLEFWHTSKPNRWRADDLNGNYRVADESGIWFVDEPANEARRTKLPKGEVPPLDHLLGVLGLPDERNFFLEARPTEKIRENDDDVLVYRVKEPVPALVAESVLPLWIEARVVAKTQRLHSIRTWREANGKETNVAELTILAYDEPIAAEKFAVADTLTEDGRIGKIADVQGLVTVKPVLHERWTPVREGLVLKPGDWLRTDARGANAAALRLVKNTGVILGPKTHVELIGPKKIRIIEGEIEITPTKGAPIELLDRLGKTVTVKDKKFYRSVFVEHGFGPAHLRLEEVAKDPPWLAGFKGATTNEALGSLVALVDGRNVPLTVGYHKVTVDIRDQIARTVIEESFVNHTKDVLEGVFYFPLPQDASISGFGMWIGDNLVEADVVEKQRAREIYETILRERRDPGLLEWAGGSIFKARVYPIPGNGEKRIKISYTQVLPLKGNRYRFGYALQSELLQQHPLRRLDIDVKVNSVAPLKSVTSPTHPTRDDRTTHSAHVEFSAQEYTPTRDFEVVVELEGRQNDVVMIPHRRGDDGYFMLQLTPPGANGDWDRPLLRDGNPVKLLILADTSASIDAGQRATQATFLGALLASLTPKDTFNLAACDVGCDWVFAKPQAANAENGSAAREFLAKRTSLGWTNLDAAFAAALKECEPGAHVIYVGDGIITAGDTDPVAFTKRLRRMYQGHGATFHAVTLGSSYEPAVVKAIASLGSGSLRRISSEQGPTVVARELLGEIAQPALRDIKVEFTGFKVARVYPETLANVPAGSQQILLGRYLPEGKDQAGEIVVTGMLGDKAVRYVTRAAFKDAESGNSFLPRLWARMHLDALLEQGRSEAIKDEIISLSEEYKIITPYTSFLVLETDADRERFKVKRLFQMRDGERFFADGRDHAVFDLAQKQMKRAGAFRTALRRSVLRELTTLGRDARMLQGRPKMEKLLRQMREEESIDFSERLGDEPDGGVIYSLGRGLGMPALAGLAVQQQTTPFFEDGRVYDSDRLMLGTGTMADYDEGKKDTDGIDYVDAPEPQWGRLAREDPFEPALPLPAPLTMGGGGLGGLMAGDVGGRAGRPYRRGPSYGSWANTLFPPLHDAPRKGKEPKSTWPAGARDLANSLLRTDQLAKLTGGIEIVRQTDAYDARWGDLASRSRRLELASAKSWLTRSSSDGGQTIISWCDAREIGVYSQAFQLGRVRASTPLDVQPPPLQLGDHSLTSVEQAYAGYTPTLEPKGKDRVLLVLNHERSPLYETRILIDTDRHVILSIEELLKGKLTETTRFDDFVQAAGSWWAQRIETTGGDGKRRTLVAQTVKAVTQNELDQQTKTELAGRAAVQLLHLPGPSVAQAKKAAAAGKASFEDQFVLMLHFYNSQQWPRVLEHLAQAEKLAGNKPGLRWVRSAVLYDSRRHDELRQRHLEDAQRIAKNPPTDAYYLTDHIVQHSGNVLQANEMLTLLDAMQPTYDKQPVHVQARKRWLTLRHSYLNQAGRSDEALRLQKQIATDYPRDYALQQAYVYALASNGDYPGAYAWLNRVLVKESKWYDWEEESLRGVYTELLERQGRFADVVKYLADWVELNPQGRTPYEQYLSGLIRTDQIEKADALARQWLKDGQKPDELPAPAASRLNAAVNLMLGNGYQISSNRVEERWYMPLADAAIYFAKHEAHAAVAERILSSYQFRSEDWPRIRKTLAAFLSGEIDKLPPAQIGRLANWVYIDDLDNKIVTSLRTRWTKETKDEAKHDLGGVIVNILSRKGDPAELLGFLRLQRQTGPAKRRAENTVNLFDTLLAQPWSADYENEAITLLDKLSDADEPGERLLASVAALHRLTDRLLESRIAVKMNLIEHPEKLTRTELLKKQADIRTAARERLADRLRQEAGKHPKALGQWFLAESSYLDVSHDRNLKQATAQAWEFVGVAPPAPKKGDDEPTIETRLDDVLRHRYLVTLANLAARTSADPALIERLLKYVDKGIDAEPERWRPAKYRLLVALDRAKDLETTLRQWTRGDDPDNRWHIALGYVLAEQGKVADAIRELEAVESADELSPSEYRSLSDWYLVENKRGAHERAAAAVYKTMPEIALVTMIRLKLYPWQRRDGHLPTELDKEVLRMFPVLFDKSVSPQNYLGYLQQFYQASHDFRLLSGLPDAVIGHSAERVYPFVQGMEAVLTEVRDEATADEIVKRIAEVRPRAKTDVDKRALDLLEVLVERRAAELINQPGPHRDKALAALVRASKGTWAPGEPRLMADFLAGLGKITPQTLADEQMRQLKALHADAKAGTLDRLHIAQRRALTLDRYERRAEAIDILQAGLDEFEAANNGVLPVSANDTLVAYIHLLQSAGHFARGEKILLAQIAHPAHAQQRRWLLGQLNSHYHEALTRGGDTTLGSGAGLYHALERKVLKEFADADMNQRHQLTTLLCQVYYTANGKKYPGVVADLKAFAFEIAPPLLKTQTNNRDSMVATIAQALKDISGPRDGIVFLLDDIDAEPRWLRFGNQDGWTRHGWTLANWRFGAKDLGDAEGRLLKLVLTELRRDLETREPPSKAMYDRRNDRGLFWAEKTDEFAKVAEQVLKQRIKSGPSVQYIADYLFLGLERRARAIEVLLAAHNQKLLDDAGQMTLVDYMQREKRFGDSIPILQPFVERRPENLDARVRLMHAYFRSGRLDDLNAQLMQTDAFFHQKDRWSEYAMSRLAASTLENELFAQSVAYYKELIPLHEKTQPGRGIGNGTLANYYVGLANAYAGLKKTPEAVDAASAAVVAWGSGNANRASALTTLKNVMLHSPDLDAFVVHFDGQKQASAVIRKALGEAYAAKKEYAKAITQLEIATLLQSYDAELYKLLIDAYDKTGDKQGAIRHVLQSIQASPRDIKLYEDLGKRYAEVGEKAEAERAYTSIVEMLPTETESHALLAEVREKQNRWPEAIAHWEEVAKLRALEPTGLLKLAAAQIHEKQWEKARESLRRLNTRTWPAHFEDVRKQSRALEGKLAAEGK